MSKWIASISNGERFSEDKLEKNGKSAWTNLRTYLQENKVNLVQLQIIVNGKRYNSPSLSDNAKFKSEKIKDLFACRKKGIIFFGHDKSAGREDNWVAFSYKLDDCRHFFWVNEENNDTYAEVQKLIPSLEKDIVI